jgi:imidazole glycerol phosphate synthase glutamine amidotransferase subunit
VIAVLDYGAGNLRSVTNALRVLDLPHLVAHDADGLCRASSIILPGVGHFGQMMRALDAMQVREVLLSRIHAGVPFLGICLGLHALFEASEEAPGLAGLGLISDSVRKFSGDMRVPHMGWNEIEPQAGARPSRLLRDLPAKTHLYFAHSYYAPVESSTSSVCEYGGVHFSAALERENVFAIQCHPEKSGAAGQKILRNFAEL